MSGEPVFYYDFQSPYAYLAAHRVDDVLPVAARWQPIAFPFVLRAASKVPWSLRPGREAGQAECERRAAQLGIPLVWPQGWPDESYSLTLLRGAFVAQEHGLLKEFSRAAFHAQLGEGRILKTPDAVAEVAVAAGVDPDAVRAGVEDDAVKERVRVATDAAIAQGVTGIPTVVAGGELFWGDDRLEDAAAALAA